MIQFKNISVEFDSRNGTVAAVKDVSMVIRRGEIFGIVGTSGAGKSTLLRIINQLQRPSSGHILIDDDDITYSAGSDLRRLRTGIGMVFQHFNLIHSKTVFQNIAFAMKAAGSPLSEICRRVPEVLDLVGLTDKSDAYPSALSGGQKQRVGIARAIANNPRVLLADEPTSALDLETTGSILQLLKEINQNLGITTVIISHEMEVIKAICDRVAVMTQGEVVELNDVFTIFTAPEHAFTRNLVNHTLRIDLPPRLLKNNLGRILKIIYSGHHAEEAVLYDTIKKFNVNVNILHGKIEYITGKPFGVLVVQLNGNNENIRNAEQFLIERTFKVEVIHG